MAFRIATKYFLENCQKGIDKCSILCYCAYMKINGYLSVNEAAELLKVDTESIYRWVRSGKLPAAKIGGLWRIRKSDIDAFFKKR